MTAAGSTDDRGTEVVDLRAAPDLPLQRGTGPARAERGTPTEAEQRAALLLEHGSDLIILADHDLGMTWASPSVTRALGWTIEELLGTPIDDLVHPDDRPLAAASLRHRPRGPGHRPTGVPLRLRSKRGVYRWMLARLAPLRKDLGDAPGVVVTLQEIDELVATREAAEATRVELRMSQLVIDGTPFPTAITTPSGRVLWVNRALCAQAGCSRGDVVGRVLTDLVHLPDDGSLDLRSLADAPGEPVRARWEVGSRVLWVDLSVTPVRDAEGRPSRLVTQFVDVSGTVSGQAQLLRRERVLEEVFLASPNGLAITDAEGRIARANPALGALLHLDPTQVVGHALSGHLGACQPDAVPDDGEQPGPRGHLHHLQHPGSEAWVEHQVRVLEDPVHGLPVLIHELSDRTAVQRLIGVLSHEDPLDPVTGLPGRGTVLTRLNGWAAVGPGRRATGFGVVTCEVDRGALAGLAPAAREVLIAQVGQRLRAQVRRSDLVARLGDNHFAVVLGFAGPWELACVAGRARRPALLSVADEVVPFRVLVGIAVGEAHEDPRAILSRAERDLARARPARPAR